MYDRQQKQSRFADFMSSLAGFCQGMKVTFVNLFEREKVTISYPYEKRPVSSRYRGLFYLPFDEEAKRLKCVGCTLCAQACPTNVISMTKLGAGKHAGVSEFHMDLGRCMFCNLCIEACPFDAIHMGSSYELATYERGKSVFHIEDLAPGGRAQVESNSSTIKAALQAEAAQKASAAQKTATINTGSHA